MSISDRTKTVTKSRFIFNYLILKPNPMEIQLSRSNPCSKKSCKSYLIHLPATLFY